MPTARRITLAHVAPIDDTKFGLGLRFDDGSEVAGWLAVGDMGKFINSLVYTANRSARERPKAASSQAESASLPVLDANDIALTDGPHGKWGVALDCGLYQLAFDLPEDALDRLLDSARRAQSRRGRLK